MEVSDCGHAGYELDDIGIADLADSAGPPLSPSSLSSWDLDKAPADADAALAPPRPLQLQTDGGQLEAGQGIPGAAIASEDVSDQGQEVADKSEAALDLETMRTA